MHASTRKPPRSDEEAMTNRRRAAALLLLPLLFVVAITSIGRYLHIFAAFDFFGAGGGFFGAGGDGPTAQRPPLRRKNERAVGASRVTSPKGGDKQIGSGAKNTSNVKPKLEPNALPPSGTPPTTGRSTESAPTKSQHKSKPTALPSKSDTKRDDGGATKPRQHAKLKLAWLMSFPNSGSSYTTKLVRTMTNASTATNYGASTRDKYGCSRPIAPELESTGPFWQSNTYEQLGGGGGGGGGGYLLTKTHCGGYCNGCGPSKYFETAQSFADACSTGKKSTHCRRYVDGKATGQTKADKEEKRFEIVRYDGTSVVERAVHLIRNPFDNVVSRFHLKAKELDSRRHDKNNNGSQNRHYEYNKDGFRKWCKHIDASFVKEESILTAFSSRKDLLNGIPCHADFIRYLLWHHYAERTQANLMLPTLVLHYEDYFTGFNETITDLMAFLGIEYMRNEPELFEGGKMYRDYFTTSEKRAVNKLARSITANNTWARIERYFSSY